MFSHFFGILTLHLLLFAISFLIGRLLSEYKWWSRISDNLWLKYWKRSMDHVRMHLGCMVWRHKWHHLTLWRNHERNILSKWMRTHFKTEWHHILGMLLTHRWHVEGHRVAHFLIHLLHNQLVVFTCLPYLLISLLVIFLIWLGFLNWNTMLLKILGSALPSILIHLV